jgi:hypothetical protein
MRLMIKIGVCQAGDQAEMVTIDQTAKAGTSLLYVEIPIEI